MLDRLSLSLALCYCSTAVVAMNFYSPALNGGSMLTDVLDTYPEGQHEPVNTIISGDSDAEVLANSVDNGGILNYFLSLHFGTECLNQHIGNSQKANLGDGNGSLNETAVMRWNYFDPGIWGTCQETQKGGNHFRYWVQNGSQANSGAYFMAVSYEKSLDDGHLIDTNGYNLGRDYLVGNITNTTIPTSSLSDTFDPSPFKGYTWSNGWTYYTEVSYLSGLLQNTNDGINHAGDVSTGGANAVDGLVAVLTVKIHERGAASGADNGGTDTDSASTWAYQATSSVLALLFTSCVLALV